MLNKRSRLVVDRATGVWFICKSNETIKMGSDVIGKSRESWEELSKVDLYVWRLLWNRLQGDAMGKIFHVSVFIFQEFCVKLNFEAEEQQQWIPLTRTNAVQSHTGLLGRTERRTPWGSRQVEGYRTADLEFLLNTQSYLKVPCFLPSWLLASC